MTDLSGAVTALRRDAGIVLYPTETVYGLGGRASDVRHVERIAALKARPVGPLIVLVDHTPPDLPPCLAAVAAALWPGPVTLIAPARIADALSLPRELRGPGGTIALRHSPHPIVQALVTAVGPITSTSANLHGEPPISDPSMSSLLVDAVVDIGPISGGLPSTIVDQHGSILRPGARLQDVKHVLASDAARA